MRNLPHSSSRYRLHAAFILAFTLGGAGAFGGCYRGTAHSVSASELERRPGWNLVSGVHLVKQSSDRDCGPAALSMVLGRWGVPTSMAEIVAAHPIEPERGMAPGGLRDFARAKGLTAFLINGEVVDLVREVKLNRPVLVGLVQHYGAKAYAHYEVVVGVNEGARRVLLLDPARGMREDGFDGFTAEWERAAKLTLVVVGPSTTAKSLSASAR